ncbi:MAG: tRNA lysidine(34) synthetase TilS [Bdellovibrionota bacterium]
MSLKENTFNNTKSSIKNNISNDITDGDLISSVVLKSIKLFLEEYNLRDKTILLAVSGGKDSVVLLDICYKLKELYNLNLLVAHFDHNLRDSSKGDADFVEKLVLEKYKLKFFRGLADRKECKENLEAWARKKRYEFLKKVYNENKIDVIFTAHTGSDVAETLCMKLISNKEPRNIYKKDDKRHLMRPMLNALRIKIDEYVKENGLEFVEDPTNADTKYLRNKVRHVLIPFLEENFNKGVEEFLKNRGLLLEEDLSTLYEIAKKELQKIKSKDKFSKAWVKELNLILESLPKAIRWRAIELVLKDELYFNIGKKTSLEIMDLFLKKRVAVNLPMGKRIYRSKGKIFLS